MSQKNKKLVPPGLVYIADNIVSKHNILGAPRKEKAMWAESLGIPAKGETIFYAGCGYQYTASLESMMSFMKKSEKSSLKFNSVMNVASLQKKIGLNAGEVYRKMMVKGHGDEAQPLRDAVKVLQDLGIQFGYLGEEEPCCGGLLHYIGLQSDFIENARDLYKTLKSFGVRRIISIVPSCTNTLKNIIPKYVENYDIKVKHFTEAVLENIRTGDLRFPREVTVTYHDPCQLGRYMDLIDEPRQILKSIEGIELVEPDWTTGEWSTCCGGGGGFEAIFPELSGILAVNRAKELVQTGAHVIVTQCPGCAMQLDGALKEMKIDDVEVMDLAQMVAQSMGG